MMEISREVTECVESYQWAVSAASFLEVLIELDFTILHPDRSEIFIRREGCGPCVGERYFFSVTSLLEVLLEGVCTPSGEVGEIILKANISSDLCISGKKKTILALLRRIAGSEMCQPCKDGDMWVFSWKLYWL